MKTFIFFFINFRQKWRFSTVQIQIFIFCYFRQNWKFGKMQIFILSFFKIVYKILLFLFPFPVQEIRLQVSQDSGQGLSISTSSILKSTSSNFRFFEGRRVTSIPLIKLKIEKQSHKLFVILQ